MRRKVRDLAARWPNHFRRQLADWRWAPKSDFSEVGRAMTSLVGTIACHSMQVAAYLHVPRGVSPTTCIFTWTLLLNLEYTQAYVAFVLAALAR